MKYYEGIDFALADVQFGSRNCKRTYPFYCGLQLVYAGEIALAVDRRREERRKGPLVFLTSPEHYYEYSSPGVLARDHYWVCFYGPKVEMYREGGLFRIDPDQPFYHLRQPELFREKMEELIRIVQSGREHDRAVCLLETLLFTVQADAESAPEETDYYRERFAELMARIAESFQPSVPEVSPDVAAPLRDPGKNEDSRRTAPEYECVRGGDRSGGRTGKRILLFPSF